MVRLSSVTRVVVVPKSPISRTQPVTGAGGDVKSPTLKALQLHENARRKVREHAPGRADCQASAGQQRREAGGLDAKDVGMAKTRPMLSATRRMEQCR